MIQSAPAFECAAVKPSKEIGTVSLDDYKGSWIFLFFSPTITTSNFSVLMNALEVSSFSERQIELNALNCQTLIVSNESKFAILAWVNAGAAQGGLGGNLKVPIASDYNREMARAYNIYVESTGSNHRAIFLISPTREIRQVTINDVNVGRSVDECVRLLKAFQLTDITGDVCPANWRPGQDTFSAKAKSYKEYVGSVSRLTERVDAGEAGIDTLGEVTKVSFTLKEQPRAHAAKLFALASKMIASRSSRAMQSINLIISRYNDQLVSNPLVTKMVTSLVLHVLLEVANGFIKRQRNKVLQRLPRSLLSIFDNSYNTYYQSLFIESSDGYSSSGSGGKYAYALRLLRIGAYGAVGAAGSHYWFRFLDSVIDNKTNLSAGVKSAVKVVINQIVYSGAWSVFTMGFFNYLVFNKRSSNRDFLKDVCKQFLLVYWKRSNIAINSVGLLVVPQRYRTLFNDFVSVFWNTFFTNILTEREEW